MLIVDTSGSMRESALGDRGKYGEFPTRLDEAKKALGVLMDSYSRYGEVRVKLISFAAQGQSENQGIWMNLQQAKQAVKELDYAPRGIGGATNYADAIAEAQRSYEHKDVQGRLDGGRVVNRSIFITDGLEASNTKFDFGKQRNWKEFLAEHDIKSEAISINEAKVTDISPIAYDGHRLQDIPGIEATPLTLREKLLNGVDVGVSSNVLLQERSTVHGSIAGGFGADGGGVVTITIDGKSYTLTSDEKSNRAQGIRKETILLEDGTTEAHHILEVTTKHNGIFTLDFDTASYDYQASKTVLKDYQEKISYTATDADGDRLQGKNGSQGVELTLSVTRDYKPGLITLGEAYIDDADPHYAQKVFDARDRGLWDKTSDSDAPSNTDETVKVHDTLDDRLFGKDEKRYDVVKVHLSQGEVLTMDVDHSGHDLTTKLEVFDSNNQPVKGSLLTATTNSSDPGSGGNTDAYATFKAEADGDYYVKVTAEKRWGGQEEKPYDLWLSIKEPVDGTGSSRSAGVAESSDERTAHHDEALLFGDEVNQYHVAHHDADVAHSDGYDILVLDHGSLNLAEINSSIAHVDMIDLSPAGAQSLTLHAADVLKLTDNTHELLIDGNKADTVHLSGEFSKLSVSDKAGYTEYAGKEGATTLYIDDDIHVDLY